jgi:hypothetical protein
MRVSAQAAHSCSKCSAGEVHKLRSLTVHVRARASLLPDLHQAAYCGAEFAERAGRRDAPIARNGGD